MTFSRDKKFQNRLEFSTYTDDTAEAISITLSINSGTLCGAGLDLISCWERIMNYFLSTSRKSLSLGKVVLYYINE